MATIHVRGIFKMLIHRGSGVFVAATLCLINAAAFAGGYTYERIAVPGAEETYAAGLTASGIVVGSWIDAKDDFTQHGFTYTAGTIKSFDYPGAVKTLAGGMNSAGDIVGTHIEYYGGGYEIDGGFVYKNGIFTSINFPGSRSTDLTGMNDAGVVVGNAAPNGVAEAFIEANGKFTTIVQGESPSAGAINVTGSVIGTYDGADNFLWAGGKLEPIVITDVQSVFLHAINNSNTVVGGISAKTGKVKSFIYQNGKLKTFDVPGWPNSSANGINNSGVVVGNVFNEHGQSSGYVYDGTSFAFVSIPNAQSQTAIFINDSGQILGEYQDPKNGYAETLFLATPKP